MLEFAQARGATNYALELVPVACKYAPRCNLGAGFLCVQMCLETWCRVVTMSEYGRSKHDDKIKEELLRIQEHNPFAWTVAGGRLVLKLNDVHNLRKLRKDVPDYLGVGGSGGDAIVFDAKELEEFLGAPMLANPLRKLARLLKSRNR